MIRDEVSKLLDVRIPPNGYRRYIKEIGRTGGFQDRQRDDCIISLCEAVEELQQQVIELKQQNNQLLYPHAEGSRDANGQSGNLLCPECDFVAKSELGLLSHRRSHKKDAITQSTKSDGEVAL